MANDLSIQSGSTALGTTMAGRNELFLTVPIQIAPSVTNVSPASGNGIHAHDFVQFDLTVSDGKGLANTLIWVEYPDRQFTELVWNGASYSYNFSGTSVAITDGLRFRFQRLGGYTSSPIIKIQATAVNGGTN